MCWNRLQIPKETEEPNNCKSYREFVLRNVIQKKKKIFVNQHHSVTDITVIDIIRIKSVNRRLGKTKPEFSWQE